MFLVLIVHIHLFWLYYALLSIKQYKSLDRITEPLIFMDDTNLRYNNLVANESKQLYDVTFTEGKILRIQISIMMKNLNLYQDMNVYI
jgi:hypothetical protein